MPFQKTIATSRFQMAPLGGPEVRVLSTAVPGGERCDGRALPVAASKSRKKLKKRKIS